MNNSEEYLNEENIDKYCEALSEELLKVDKSEYLMDEALEATGDHAVVRVDADG